MRVGIEVDGIRTGVPQSRQIEDLHPVLSRAVGDDEGVVPVDLDVAPRARVRPLRHHHAAHVAGRLRVGDVDEGGRVAQPHQRVLAPGLGVRPSPDVVGHHAGIAAHLADRHERQDVHGGAVERPGAAVLAGHRAADGRVVGRLHEDLGDLGPAVIRRLEDVHRAQAPVPPRSLHRGHGAVGRDLRAEAAPDFRDLRPDRSEELASAAVNGPEEQHPAFGARTRRDPAHP